MNQLGHCLQQGPSWLGSELTRNRPVWDPYRHGDINKLNKSQRAAARFPTSNYQRKSSVTALIQDLGWTDLQTTRKNFRLTSLYKILNGLIAVPAIDLLTPADERTRGGHKKNIQNHTRLESSFIFDIILQQHLLCGVSGWRGERAGRLSQPADS